MRLRNAMGISTTRNLRLLRTIISKTILKLAGGGDAYSSNRERADRKKSGYRIVHAGERVSEDRTGSRQ